MCWEGLGAGGEGEDRGWDGRMASLTQWTWVSVNSGSWWWTGRPGVLRFMGSQRVRHDWATDLIWSEVQSIDIPERINHFNLWPILLLVICMLILSCTSCLYVLEMNPLWISPLPFASLLFSAICQASSNNHFAFLHFFPLWGMVLVITFCAVLRTYVHSCSGTLSTRSSHLNLLVSSTV